MTTVLLTGFEPFADSPLNPSAEVIKTLAAKADVGDNLYTTVLPVVSKTAPDILCRRLETLRPDVYIGLGEARGRSAINLERVAVNELNFRIPDNSGQTLLEQAIVVDGPPTYGSTFLAQAILDAIRARAIPAVLSDSAGRYLCNQVLYTALHWAATNAPSMQVGFIHLPSLPAQMARCDEPKPTMALALQVEAMRVALTTIRQLRQSQV